MGWNKESGTGDPVRVGNDENAEGEGEYLVIEVPNLLSPPPSPSSARGRRQPYIRIWGHVFGPLRFCTIFSILNAYNL